MLISPEDLVRALEGKGGELFEAFVHDLLRLEAQREGRPVTDIDWDHRTPVRDGGRDIVVRCVSASADSAIPPTPSIWSMKAGQNGKNPTTLGNDVEGHEKIGEHLDNGGCFRYVVLQPCSNDEERDRLTNKATELCAHHGWNEQAIKIIFVDHLRDFVIRCPTLIPCHLPDIALRLGPGATAARDWIGNRRRNSTSYIPLDSRRQLETRLASLLSGESEERYIHVAGWSGVGKSRLVAEVLASTSTRDLVVVYHTWDEFKQGLLSSLRSGQVGSAIVIVDEVDLQHVLTLTGVCDERVGVRVISLGASEHMSRMPQHCNFIERPDSEDLSKIIAERSHGLLDSNVVHRLADLSDGDVNFAEMLCDAAADLGNAGSSPSDLIEALRDLSAVVRMYFQKHAEKIGNINEFRSRFAVLTLLSEVGIDGDRASELEALAKFSGKHRADLDQAIGCGKAIGVCRCLGDLLECMPRPLAAHVFETDAWPLIERHLLEFYTILPTERARRSFLRRVTYCSAARREEVERLLAGVFLERFKDADLRTLSDPEVARTLRAFVETIPQVGLAWLRSVIERASVAELREFPGSSGIFGPTYGRREVVWLCEHLRCFSDCFDDAEAILFRLALAETAEIGNNATAEWKQCFWWRLSGTEVLFPHRIDILLRRLDEVTHETAVLVLEGVVAALHDPMSGMVPPEFVGGRLTPPEWRPALWRDLYGQWDRVIEAAVETAKSDGELGRLAVHVIIENLELFVRRGLSPVLRDQALNPSSLDDSILRSLRLALDRLLLHFSELPDEVRQDIVLWKESLKPKTLFEQIREIVGRAAWDHERNEDDHEAWRSLYDELAEKIALEPNVLNDSVEWLESEMAQSTVTLGAFLGRSASARETVRAQMIRWLNEGRVRELVAGYFVGSSGDDRVLPEWAKTVLEDLLDTRPDDVVRLIVEADVTRAGLDRLYRALPNCTEPPSRLLGRLFGAHWEAIQQPEDQRLILDTLEAALTDEHAIPCALHLLNMWNYRAKDDISDALDDVIGKLVHRAIDEKNIGRVHEWDTAASWWVKRHPADGARLLVEIMTSEPGICHGIAGEAEKLLRDLAHLEPDAVAEAIERTLQSQDAPLAFHVSVFHGLFEPLGLERIKAMIERLGEDGASAIARHLPDPDTDVGQETVEWFLTEYADNERVFSSYLCGRHSGEVVYGHAFDRRAGVYERTEPFINHETTGVRKWAQWERDVIDEDAEWDRKRVEEMGRE